MNRSHLYIEIILLAEIAVVFMTIFTIQIYAFFQFLHKKRFSAIKLRALDYLESLLKKNREDYYPPPKNLKKRFDIWLEILLNPKKEVSPHWQQLEYFLLEETILPLARKQCKQRYWLKRLFAAQVFSLHPLEKDENYILKMITDKTPLIVLYACSAATKIPNEKIIKLCAERISTERRLTRSLFLNAFNNANSCVELIIQTLLKNEPNLFIRTTYYEMLTRCIVSHPYEIFTSDLETAHIDLKIATIRYLAYALKEKSIPIFLELITDPHWQVRAVIARYFGELKAQQSLSLLETSLKDPQWWVRINAANALYLLEDIGIQALKNQTPEQDLFAYETAQFVLLSSS